LQETRAQDGDVELTRARERTLRFWLCVGLDPVGYGLLREIDVGAFMGDLEYWLAADGHSHESADLAQAILSFWSVEGVFAYGLVVNFSRLWVDSRHARGSLWAAPLWALLSRRYGRRGHTQGSLLLLKPFPLEYEGRVTEPQTTALNLRTAAMRRLYARTLQVQPLPKGEWMWRAFRDGIPRPRRRRRRLLD
jgi:hypothetical protein